MYSHKCLNAGKWRLKLSTLVSKIESRSAGKLLIKHKRPWNILAEMKQAKEFYKHLNQHNSHIFTWDKLTSSVSDLILLSYWFTSSACCCKSSPLSEASLCTVVLTCDHDRWIRTSLSSSTILHCTYYSYIFHQFESLSRDFLKMIRCSVHTIM